MSAEEFGTLPDGRAIERVTISGGGLTARIMTFGASLQDLRLEGEDHPLVLGSDQLEDYMGPLRYFGATVGRYANRIAGGRFSLNGRQYQLDRNEAARTCLHGGSQGFGVDVWTLASSTADRAVFTLHQPDGHMGFPGAVEAEVIYRIVDGALEICMQAVCTADCPVSMANHAYFNLDGSADARDHSLRIAAAHYTPVDDHLIPTGEIAPVEGTDFDFRNARPIGPAGYDHNFCLDEGTGLREAAELTGTNGLSLRVETDAPGLQVYDLAHLPEGTRGLDGRSYGPNGGIAMETQNWPDAPNQPNFPETVVKAGTPYRNLTRLSFHR